MAFHPEDRVVASCSEDKSIKLWNLDDGGLLSTMKGHSKDNEECTCTHGQYEFQYEANPDCPVRGHTDQVMSVCFSPDGAKIVSGSFDRKVLIWDAASGEQLCSLRGE